MTNDFNWIIWLLGTPIATVVLNKGVDVFIRSRQPNTHDLEVWKRIENIFTEEICGFLRDQSIEVAFVSEPWLDLLHFASPKNFALPDFEFHDSVLRKNFSELREVVKTLSTCDVEHNIDCLDHDPSMTKMRRGSNEDDKSFRDRANTVNDITTDLINKFDDLQRIANKKFSKKIL